MDPVTICNMALGHLGDLSKAKRLTAFTEAAAGNNTAHHAALTFYDASKREMHALYDWPRTRKVQALTVSADAPLLDGTWTYKYARPADALVFRKVLDTDGKEYAFDQVNETDGSGHNVEWIYCNESDVLGWWTILIGEERYMPGMEELHSLILAQKLAMTVTAKIEVRLAFVKELEGRTVRFCKSLAAQEGYVEAERGEHQYTDCY